MKSERAIFNRLVQWAKKNKSLKQERRQFHVAAIYHKNKQISLACNSIRTHPRVKRHYPDFVEGIHAEFAAILMAENLVNLSDCKLFVLRIDNNGQLANSAPCLYCSKIIEQIRFKKLIHS